LGSDHDLLSGWFSFLIPSYHMYTTPDWDAWRKYVHEETAVKPTHFGHAYKELIRLTERFSRMKIVG